MTAEEAAASTWWTVNAGYYDEEDNWAYTDVAQDVLAKDSEHATTLVCTRLEQLGIDPIWCEAWPAQGDTE